MLSTSLRPTSNQITFQGKNKHRKTAQQPLKPKTNEATPTSSATIETEPQTHHEPQHQPNFFLATMRTLSRLGVVAGFTAMGIIAYDATQQKNFNPPNSGLITSSQWGNNINVIASASQKHISTNRENFSFTDALVKELSGLSGIGETTSHLETEGYTNLFQARQFPLSSNSLPTVTIVNSNGKSEIKPNQCLNTWNKDGHPEKKFAIVLSGYSPQSRLARKMAGALQENFGLTNDHIHYERHTSSKTLTAAVNEFKAHIKEKNIKNAELLLYYNGHGSTLDFPWFTDLPSSEGKATGRIQLSDGWYSENKLKKLLKTLPTDVKVTVVMDTCHSGSWIA